MICDQRRIAMYRTDLPSAKTKGRELEIGSQVPIRRQPSRQIKCVWVREDIWIARDGPF